MTKDLYPAYYELFKNAPLLVRKAIIKAYEETGNISEVARLFQRTRKTVRKLLQRLSLPRSSMFLNAIS